MSISIESERDSASTARRERAEKYIEDDTAVWANEWTWEGEDIINAYLAGAREEAARAATKLRAAAAETRTPFGEQLLRLAAEIEEGA